MKLRVGAHVVAEAAGQRIEFTDLQQALLLLLADAGNAMSRRRIAEVLWEEDDGSTSPRRRLRQVVYGVNRRMTDAILVGDQARLGLAPTVEVIWTGEDAGASIESPSPSWARLREDLHDRARARSRSHTASAVDSARLRDDPGAILELIATDADPGSMWRDAVWALLRAGRIREAEATFGELGIEDPELVRRCRDAIGRLVSGSAPGPVPHAVDGPVVGREEILGLATASLERGDRRVVLSGPSGVGLTRVLGALSAWVIAEQDDLVVVSTRCSHSGRSIAYDTLNQLFDSPLFRSAHAEVDEPWRSILARVLRVYGRDPEKEIEPLEGTSATLRVLHAISALIQKAIGNATLMAVVDDLHLADPGSLTVLTHLGVDGEGAVIRLLGSCRTDISVPGAPQALLTRSESTVLEVSPLDSAASAQMLLALRPELSEENARALASLCGGFPRRLEDVAQSVEGDGSEVAGATLEELLQLRLGELDEAEQDVSALLSVRPDGLDAETLMSACELGTLQLARAVRRLSELGIAEEGPRIRIWSSFLRRGIRSSIPETIRRALHLRIAEVLQQQTPPAAGDIGRHYHEAGRPDEALAWLRRGAREAADAEAFPVATELAELAVDIAPDDADLQEMLGDLLSSEGRFAEASEHLGRAIEIASSTGDSGHLLGLRMRWVRARCEHVFDSKEVGDEARAVLEDAQAEGDLDTEAHAIDVLFRIGDYCLDFDLVYEALDHLFAARERATQSPYLDWVEVRRAYIDDPEAARAAAWRFFEWSEPGSADRLMALVRLLNQGMTRGPAGDEDVRAAVADLESFESAGHSYLRSIALSSVANWYLERGELEVAAGRFSQALEVGRRLRGSVLGVILTNQAEIALRRGDLGEAERIAAAHREGSAVAVPRDRMTFDFAEAWLRLEKGQMARANELVEAWPEITELPPNSFFLVLPVSVLTRVLVARGRTTEARSLLTAAIDRAAELVVPRAVDALEELRGRLRL